MRIPLLLALSTPLLLAPMPAQTKLLRFPDLHGDTVVFTHGGDLWKAPLAGGTAVRLSSAKGLELFAKFSPDGRTIAFTGQVDGDEQVYVIPADGGEPVQLTFYPARGPLPDRWGWDNQVYGFTPDGTAVLFRSLREAWTMTRCQLYTVALPGAAKTRGALPVPLPMPVAGAGDFSPDGMRIVYSPLFRDFRTWKRYEGGWAQDLWVFDPVSGSAENITNHPRTDRDPMWIGDRIWFASDRTGTMNLWSYDPKSQRLFQETLSTTWDVRWPSAGGPGEDRVVYEQGGELRWFDCKTRQDHAIAIRVPDEGLLTRATVVDAKGLIEGVSASPGARRTAFAARGEILTVPLEHGDLRNLTRSPGAHDKHPAFSPDGTQIAFVSDRSGEEQIWLVDHLGQEAPRQLTKGLAVMLYEPSWSPDGASIAFSDKDGVLRTVDVATGAMTDVADEPRGRIDDYVWSPCSGHLAFSMTGSTELSAIWIWSKADGALRRVSRQFANDTSPAWDPAGERLFFVGLRGFEPRLARDYEWDFQIDRARGLFALALRKDLGPWLPRRSDEAVAPKEDAAKPAAEKGDKTDQNDKAEPGKPAPAAPTRIDFDGLCDRVEAIPVPFDNYTGLAANDKGLVYARTGAGYYGREPDRKTALLFFDREKREVTELSAEASTAVLSTDGKKVVWKSGSRWLAADAAASGKDGQKEIAAGALSVERVPADEWWQIFHEVWRRYRDFFYVANMHGYDWEALRQQYAPLVAHVRHRSDLTFVLGEMVAELNCGHAYVTGGDIDRPARAPVALPGAVFRFDAASGRYRIERILEGENDDPVYKAPLRAVGVDAREGDYVLAIDGEDLAGATNPYRLLRHKQNRRVTLTLAAEPAGGIPRTVAFDPIASEEKLHYLAFVRQNRARTEQLSGGRLGYVHLPDMGADGLREFVKQYYPQRDKDGLVIDDRSNGGGNVSQMVLNRLARKLLMATFGRTTGFREYPSATFRGHLVCLLNETSASDGDIFPAMFRKAGLGKLVGKRSWGGIIGITDRGPLLDGGVVNVPEFGNTELGEAWTIEGYGVDPDLVVDNDVKSVLAGRDPQLEKGIEVLLEQIAKDPRPLPQAPPAPVRTGR